MSNDWTDPSRTPPESEAPSLTDAEVLGSLRVLVVDDDVARGRAFLSCIRDLGVTAFLATHDGRGLVDAAEADPEVVLALGAPPSETSGVQPMLRRHPRLRWASFLTPEGVQGFPSPLDDDFGPRLAALVRPLVSADRRLERLARTRRQFAARIDSIGPSRTLRALSHSEGCLRLTVSSPQALSEIDLSDGLVAGATWIELVDGTPRELVGPTALSALVELETGLVFVERRARPELLDVMLPADEALSSATLGLGADAPTSPEALELPSSAASEPSHGSSPSLSDRPTGAATTDRADPPSRGEMDTPVDTAAVAPGDAAAWSEAPAPATATDRPNVETDTDTVVSATSVPAGEDDTPTMRPAPGEGPDDLFDEPLRSAALRAPSIPPVESLLPPANAPDAVDDAGPASTDPETVTTAASQRLADADADDEDTPSARVRHFSTQKAFPPPELGTTDRPSSRPEPVPESFLRRPASTIESFRLGERADARPGAADATSDRRGSEATTAVQAPAELAERVAASQPVSGDTASYQTDALEARITPSVPVAAARATSAEPPGELPSVKETMRMFPDAPRATDERPTRPDKKSAIPAPRLREADLPRRELGPPTGTPTARGPFLDPETDHADEPTWARDRGEIDAMLGEPSATAAVASVVPGRYVPTDPPVVQAAAASAAGRDGSPSTVEETAEHGWSENPPPPGEDARQPPAVAANGTGHRRAASPSRMLWAAAAILFLGVTFGAAAYLQNQRPARSASAVAPDPVAKPTAEVARPAALAPSAAAPPEPATDPSEVQTAEVPADDLEGEAPDDGERAVDEAAAETAGAEPERAVSDDDGASDAPAPGAPEEDPERDQERSDALVAEARDLLLDGGDPARIQSMLDEALLADDRNPRAEEIYAELMLGQGRADQAEAHARRAVDLRRRRASYRVLLGDALWALGRQDEARTTYAEAVDLDPDDPVARARLAR